MNIEDLIFETIDGRFGVIATDEHDQADRYFDTKEEAINFIKEKYKEQLKQINYEKHKHITNG